jgi:hypothetical protein
VDINVQLVDVSFGLGGVHLVLGTFPGEKPAFT